jgi:hypothetical protein
MIRYAPFRHLCATLPGRLTKCMIGLSALHLASYMAYRVLYGGMQNPVEFEWIPRMWTMLLLANLLCSYTAGCCLRIGTQLPPVDWLNHIVPMELRRSTIIYLVTRDALIQVRNFGTIIVLLSL